ncbi:alpha/beta hydrolase family esterase [Aquabacterium sp.]|uniref:alpha/beta hydrolase family esterase n=1 Tax=Aquabacterium sp. TaxID=1872578 RepID=UPI0035C6DF2E
MPCAHPRAARPHPRALLGLFGMLCVWALLPQAAEARLSDRLRERLQSPASQTSAPDAAVEPITTPGDRDFTLVHGGETRRYKVHVPRGYSPDRPTALVLAFHGGGGNMNVQANDRHYGQISKADELGYVVVFPNGVGRLPGGKMATWNAGACCGEARDRGADDVGFVRALLARLKQQLNVDASRVFATGMSNGGMMSYRLACEMADSFTAIAAVAGTDNTLSCTPSRPVSVLHIHAVDDERVLFNGGAGSKASQMTDFVSVPKTIAKWVALDGCQGEPQRVLAVPGAHCDLYSACRGGSQVKLCVTDSGGHSWPGGRKPMGGAQGSQALSATDLIGEFFMRR